MRAYPWSVHAAELLIRLELNVAVIVFERIPISGRAHSGGQQPATIACQIQKGQVRERRHGASSIISIELEPSGRESRWVKTLWWDCPWSIGTGQPDGFRGAWARATMAQGEKSFTKRTHMSALLRLEEEESRRP